MKNFDSNLILKELNQEYFNKCKIIPKSTEKFLSFSLDNVKFLDSYQFLSASLDSLVKNLRFSGLDSFKITKNVFEKKYGKIEENALDILLRKATYPYEYLNSFQKFNEKRLPDKKYFYSTLNFSSVDDEKYLNTQFIWKYFRCENIGDFHYLYVLLDSCLLADIFTCFRKKTLKIYGLDPCHYYSIPSLSWNAMLKYTNVEIELFRDIDMFLFIEKNIKGGISQTIKRYSSANNIEMMEKFDPLIESKYLIYFDGNYEFNINNL